MTSLDASALASIFVDDEHSPAVRRWLGARPPGIMVSTFAAAEFAAVVGRHVRMRHLGVGDGAGMLLLFDMWLSRDAETLEVEPEDHRVAASFVRRFDLGLRAPDALHIAACRRLGLSLLTFDRRQAAAAAALGVACDPAGAMAGPAEPSARRARPLRLGRPRSPPADGCLPGGFQPDFLYRHRGFRHRIRMRLPMLIIRCSYATRLAGRGQHAR